jgi:hypothetical protein
MLAFWMTRIRGLTWPRRSVRLLAVCSWAVVLASLLLGLDRLGTSSAGEYQAALRSIQDAVPANASIMGSGFFWLGLRQHQYVPWHELTYYRRYVPGSALSDAIRAYHPDYLILDGNTDWHTSDHPEDYEPWAQLLYLPKTELAEFLERYATLVGESPTYSFGYVRVYRINWGQSNEAE